MARRGGNRVKVKVEGLSELAQIPGWLEDGQRRFVETSATRIAEKVAAAAPGGATGSVGRKTRGRALSSTRAEIVVDHPGARALEQGAFIKPRRGRALRFTRGGETVYVRSGVRIAPRRFAKKGLRSRGRVVRQAYQEAFDNLQANG